MDKQNGINFLVEWAIWVHLDSKTDLELILLKGHLILDNILLTVLKSNDFPESENYSFYRKIIALETLEDNTNLNKNLIISSLREINNLRNKIAHEFNYKISNSEFEIWATNILNNMKGEKFSKYTFRTRIVHSFSVLSMNILKFKKL